MKSSKKLTSLALSSILLTTPLIGNQAFAAGTGFKDISNSYAKDAIAELANAGILNGVGNGNFDPKGGITRQDFAIVMAKSLNLDVTTSPVKATFKDVPTTSRSFAYVEAIAKAGIIKGYSNGEFKGTQNLSREQMAVLFVRALGADATGYGEKLTFSDSESISSYAKDAVGYAIDQGLLKGTNENTFNPAGQAKREAVAIVASKFLTVKKELDEKKLTPEPTPEPTPTPVSTPSLLTSPEVTSTVTRAETSLSFTPGTAWVNKITNVSTVYNGGNSVDIPLNSFNLQNGKMAFEALKPGETLVVTIKAAGYKNKVVTLEGPLSSSELGIDINLKNFSVKNVDDTTVLSSENTEEVTVEALKNSITSTDGSVQTYEILSNEKLLTYGTPYIVNATSEDGTHNKKYQIMLNRSPVIVNEMVNQNANVGKLVKIDLSSMFTDADGDPLTITSDKGTVDEAENTWTYFPVEGDMNVPVTVTLTATDGKGGKVSDIFDITVAANQAPNVTNVSISGTAQEGQILTGSYKYLDNEDDSEGSSTFKWYRSSQADGTDKEEISGITSSTYTLTTEDIGQYIFFEVTPIASTGEVTGNAQISSASKISQAITDLRFIRYGAMGDIQLSFSQPVGATSVTILRMDEELGWIPAKIWWTSNGDEILDQDDTSVTLEGWLLRRHEITTYKLSVIGGPREGESNLVQVRGIF